MTFALGWPHTLLDLFSSALLFALHLAVVARAITRPNRTPASRVAWVAVIMFLPLLGVIAYLFLGETSIGRRRIHDLHRTIERMPLPDDSAGTPPDVALRFAKLFELARSINGFHPVAGNRIELLGDPDAPIDAPMVNSDIAIAALVADIEQAREHVHISFYIWLDDNNGGKVADAVCAAARRGVQCRVMVDALGSRAFTRSPRWRQLRDAGVQTLATLNDIPRLGNLAIGRVDLRNHRKIVVIDNRIAYCGSQNCADPEFRTEPRYAPWIDIFLRCEGPVVRQEQFLFLSAWIAETGEQSLEALPSALPLPQRVEPGVIAQMFGTGPTTRGNAMSDMFVATIYAAREELLVTTPYFVPDEALLRALCAAPRRSVKTTIIFPARNNSWLVGSACYSTYDDLLACGVEIFEYPLGLLHTKSMTVDCEFALVGSANMDRRSLQLNFENNMLVADRGVTDTIRQRQLSYLAASRPVTLESVRAWPFHRRLVQDAVGMTAPLL
ncbi:cardiolipin synthase [Solilutibacter silvestris]|uniref:Cardiolipin synthase n=1 Tax=Solilutibacter silvestris TaxID=1645665 RepID=A0A2K1PYM2_9GAMM|nr:cardiolipin synthase [Lysobacter silvestris]PNS07894.1 cardiolipin synthase [Lysobacter silvestris]